MGVRESLNRQNPKAVAGVIAGVVVVTAVLLVGFECSGEGSTRTGPAKAYFTVDDGKNWFLDDASKLPPFQKDGKEAVRVYLYRCGENQKPFAGFLQRYTPKEKQRLQAAREQSKSGHPAAPMLDAAAGTEVKAPGRGSWIKQSDPRARTLMMPKCPDGGNAQMVLP
jgi:hypothetical protein